MAKLSYTTNGQKKNTPIIFIHGGGTDKRVWDKIVPAFSSNYFTITYDLRGHGQSPNPTKPANHVADLYALFTHLNMDRAIVVGHSLGGQIATDFAILHPCCVEKLILIAPGLTGFVYDDAFQEMNKKMWGAVPDVDAMLDIMMHSPKSYAMTEALKSDRKNDVKTIHQDNIVKSLQWENFKQVWEVDATSRLTEIRSEILFIYGSRDKSDILKIKRLFEANEQLTVECIPQADHGLLFTQPKMIEKIILLWLKSKMSGSS